VATNIKEFFSAFSSEEQYFLNLPIFWTVTITGVDKSSINGVLSDAGEAWNASVSPNDFTKTGGILVAQEVTLPTESSTFTAMESGSTGGFLPGYSMNTRANFLDRSVSVNFLQTEKDIEHNFFRPWMIAIGIHGLIEDKDVRGMKGTMEVKQFSNSGKFIKGFRFKKVFPTAIEGYTLNYDATDFIVKSVTFACENYEQLVGDSPLNNFYNQNTPTPPIASPFNPPPVKNKQPTENLDSTTFFDNVIFDQAKQAKYESDNAKRNAAKKARSNRIFGIPGVGGF